MERIEGGVTAAKGFEAACAAAGHEVQGPHGYGTGLQPGALRDSRDLYHKCGESGSGEMGSEGCEESPRNHRLSL